MPLAEDMGITPEQMKKLIKTLEALELRKGEPSESIQHLLKNLVDALESDHQHIVRGMVFPEGYDQPGIALLHYFGRIARQHYPDIALKVSVTQKNNFIKLVVTTPTSHRQTLEEMLEQYGQILQGALPLTTLAKQERHLMEFKQKLDLSALELRITKDLLEDNEIDEHQTLQLLEEGIRSLHALVGAGVRGLYHLNELLHLSLKKDHKETHEAMQRLLAKLSGLVTEKDEETIKADLLTIMQKDPAVFDEIYAIISSHTVSGKTGGFLSSWMASLSNILPR